MKKIFRYTAFLIAALTVLALLASCGEWEETTVSDTTDIPVIETEPSTYGITGIDDAQLISGVSTKYALLANADTLQAVAAKNSRELMYPASMTKVMTFIVAYENARSLEDKMAISKEMKNKYADASRIGIDIGDILTIEQLLYALILESDTDAALALAEYIAGSEEEFVELMNAKCDELGLASTKFSNATGLHDDGHYTTASEMASIFAYALDIELFRKIVTTETYVTYLEYYKDGVLADYRMTFQNTTISPKKGRFAQNKISLSYGGGEIIGGKTGYTDEARYCLALLVRGDNCEEYILVTAKAPSARENAADSRYICENYAN